MPKFNIYKVNRTSKEDLVEKIESVGLTLTSSQSIRGYYCDFYISTEPDEVDIWWVSYYRNLIDSEDTPTNLVNFGLLLIYNATICYAISLGKSHFYIKPFCDTNFGINLAERIIDINNLRLKNSKHYKTQKNKSITSYINNTLLDYDSGESLHYIKAKTINNDDWGNIASFGHSALISLDINVNEIPNLINRIENKLQEPALTNIPKAETIKDIEQINQLDNLLINALINDNDSSVDNQEFDISGVDFIFSDNNQYRFILKGTDISSVIYDDLTIDSLREFIGQNNINLNNDLNNINAEIIREEGRNFSKPIKQLLEFITNDRECLIDGKWHKFNQSYIDLLLNYVNQIQINYNPNLDSNNITEDHFNDERVNEGYVNVHTDLVTLANRFKVEKMDLYLDRTLYFVKKGTPQKLTYVVDQALNTITLLKNNELQIEQRNGDLPVNKLCLWLLITDRVNNITQIGELNSIIFLMKLMHLNKEIQNIGFEKLELNINYIR